MSDSRPINTTPPALRITESISRDKPLVWLDRFQAILLEQHGLVPGSSTAGNLAECDHDWCLSLIAGNSVDVVYMDNSRACDRVSHYKLIAKLVLWNKWLVTSSSGSNHT